MKFKIGQKVIVSELATDDYIKHRGYNGVIGIVQTILITEDFPYIVRFLEPPPKVNANKDSDCFRESELRPYGNMAGALYGI